MISGVILAGGTSSRFSGSKRKHDTLIEGQKAIFHILRRLENTCDKIFLSTNDNLQVDTLTSYDVEIITDEREIDGVDIRNTGPLTGILSTITHLKGQVLFSPIDTFYHHTIDNSLIHASKQQGVSFISTTTPYFLNLAIDNNIFDYSEMITILREKIQNGLRLRVTDLFLQGFTLIKCIPDKSVFSFNTQQELQSFEGLVKPHWFEEKQIRMKLPSPSLLQRYNHLKDQVHGILLHHIQTDLKKLM